MAAWVLYILVNNLLLEPFETFYQLLCKTICGMANFLGDVIQFMLKVI